MKKKAKVEFYANNRDRLILVFFPTLATEEACLEVIRDMFEESGFATDTVIEDGAKESGPLGVRVYLHEPRPRKNK